MSPSMGVSILFQGDNQCSEIQSCKKRKLVCILIHMACFGKCDFTPPPSSSLLLAMALMEVLCPMLSILEKLLGPAQIPQVSLLLENCSWLGVPEGPFCYDSRTNQSQLRKWNYDDDHVRGRHFLCSMPCPEILALFFQILIMSLPAYYSCLQTNKLGFREIWN